MISNTVADLSLANIVQDIYEVGDQLVYSYDDRVGYGFHGDFFNGWKPGVVESLLDQCTYQTVVRLLW